MTLLVLIGKFLIISDFLGGLLEARLLATNAFNLQMRSLERFLIKPGEVRVPRWYRAKPLTECD